MRIELIRRASTWLVLAYLAMACGSGGEGPFFIRGSARLPSCTEAPAFDLDGTAWVDSGTLIVTTSGCDLEPDVPIPVCGLLWEFTQTGNDVSILVDNEYQIEGRMCGDQLHLEGGWWLPVQDDTGNCTYQEEDAAEVGIESEGATLTVSETELSGTLVVREACTAEYTVSFFER